MSRSGERRPTKFRCACGHRWLGAHGEISAERLAYLLASALCPRCGTGGVDRIMVENGP